MTPWLAHRHNRSRLFRWSATFGGFAMVQLLVQVLNATAGFLLVRTLEKPDYAWFTIASSMSVALSVLSDSGVGSAVTAIGGEVWQDRASLKGLVHAALRTRRILAALASVIVAGISVWLLLRNGAEMGSALVLTALVLAPIWQISTSAVLNVVNRLHSRNRQLQAADLAPALVRASLTVLLVAAGIITPVTALFAVLIGHLTQFVMVRRQVLPLLGVEVEPLGIVEHTGRIWKLVHQMMPNCIFICIQGQIATWLISIFATTSQVADLGALNRLGILFAILGGPIGQYVAPAFARTSNRRRLWLIAMTIVGGSLVFSACLLVFAWWRGEWLLWLLGGKYVHLRDELVLIIAGMSLSSLSGLLWSLNIARSWARWSWLNIPLTLIVQTFSIFAVDMSSVEGLAWFMIWTAAVQCCHALLTCAYQLNTKENSCIR